MKKIILISFLILIFASCTVITMEPYRTADTLGGPLHFRFGAGVQLGQLISQQSNPDEFHNGDAPYPVVNAYVGTGLLKNLDLYLSAGITLPSVGTAVSLKYQFYDKLGLKFAIIPAFRYNSGSNSSSITGDTIDYKYNIIGGELPLCATFSVFNIILVTAGVQGGYYRMAFDEDSRQIDYNMISYGFYLIPEVKLLAFRITPSVDFRWFTTLGSDYVASTSGFHNIYPSLSLSLQF